MIYVNNPIPQPDRFDELTIRPGQEWLSKPENADERPKDYWSCHRVHLARGFEFRCGYLAMHDPDGTIDHYWSCNNHRRRAYEWGNYRYISGRINSSKQDVDDRVLDPFEVQDSWFTISLPDLQILLTNELPAHEITRANFTIERFRLNSDPLIIEIRQEWLQTFIRGEVKLTGLERKAPLIARALRERLVALQERDTTGYLQQLVNGTACLSEEDGHDPNLVRILRRTLQFDRDTFEQVRLIFPM